MEGNAQFGTFLTFSRLKIFDKADKKGRKANRCETKRSALIGGSLMSASSTSSSTGCSQEDGADPPRKNSDDVAGESTLKKRMQQYGAVGAYANSTISTLDRSQYQCLPLNGTRRVTVQFGRMKIVVPWKESDQTVGQLAEAALIRYKKAKGLTANERIRVLRLECESDHGVLDMDDVLEEVFDLYNDQILAITDEANGGSTTPTYSQIQKQHQHHYAQPLPYSRKIMEGPPTPIASAFGSVSVNHQAPHRSASPYNVGFARGNPPKDRRDSVVEVSGFENLAQSGLRVSVSTPTGKSLNEPILRSSLRTEASGSRADDTPVKQSRVTLSPEVEKKLAEQEGAERRSERKKYEKNPGRFNRGSDRKSRITDAHLEARDRIADHLESQVDEKSNPSSRATIEQGPLPGTTLVTFAPPAGEMGIEVNAVFDESPEMPSTSELSKLSSIQVMKIEEGGRVGKDGRIRVGDLIVAIDGKSVDQMSIIRARASISELANLDRPVTLVINRSLDSFLDQESAKPIQSALQQANTQYIGHTTVVELVKSAKGFGFTVTGRQTAKNESLFYIGTVKPYGVALGHLKSGDRLLEINGVPTGQFTQSEIVDKLKETMVGEKIKFLVSRVSQTNNAAMNSSMSSENKENEGTPKVEEEKKSEIPPPPQKLPLPALMTPPVPKETPTISPSSHQRFEIVIPFINGSSSAGLGVSLKARVSKKSNGSKVDCGIFIKNVMHGGAAFKEGGLRVNDRIIGVEDINFESLSNLEAQDALSKKLKEVSTVRSSVTLTILRDNEYLPGHITRDLSRITVDASSPSPSSRMSSHTAPDSLLQSPHTRATSSSGADSSHSRQSSSSSAMPAPVRVPTERDSIVSDSTRHDESELPDNDPFNREAPGRKSLSEKRGLGAAADPQHIKLFQEIKHQRQNSAPTSSTQKRSKSQPRSLSQRNHRSPMKLLDLPQAQAAAAAAAQQQAADDSDMLNRRSQSMESINRPVESILRGTGQIHSASKVQFATKTSDQQHPFPPGAALLRLKNEESRSRDKSRRKSMGNPFSAMRNFFGFGSKSRDASPEKSVELRSVERPKSIGEERKEQNPVPPPPPPHGARRGSGGNNVFVDYGEPYGLIPQYPHNTSQIMASNAPEGIRLISYTKNSSPPPAAGPATSPQTVHLGNSKFYSSYREPSITQRPRLPDMSRTPTLSSTTGMQPIAIIHEGASTKTTTSSGNRAVPRLAHRPMSTMDYQHLMRTMSMPEYHPKPAEVSRKPRCVVYIPPTIPTTSPTISTSPRVPATKLGGAPTTTTTCSTRGSRTLAAGQSVPHLSSSRPMDHRRSGSQQRRPLNEANRSPLNPVVVRRPRPLTVGEEALLAEPLHRDHHPVSIPRRRSMRMLDMGSSTVARPDSLFLDTEAGSAQRRLPPTSAVLRDTKRVEDPARRVNTAVETRDRLIVFPSTRFPIAASSMRVSSAAKPLQNSVNLRSVPNNKVNDSSANERISLRARKKLHREAVTRSEFFLPSYSNENIKLFNSLLPPSTSSIMKTTPSPITNDSVPPTRKL
ncbi:hypothetical protein B9Z55_009425 [Caenorhabditis nigoni]|uniref:PDZ domain-containing protein n=1 Tax=Caenorhabditis nigoni TaxID=1611254 RepID=A0A2G5US67_9PELO|nr:hypothetical protein B9Z55_009425 [Caenorhabditis nigoni]